MTIADVKSGGWASHELLTSAQMNAIRAELLKCVDGAGGGTYTLSAPLILGGAALRVDTEFFVNNTAVLNSDGNVNIRSGATLECKVGSALLVRDDATFEGSTVLDGDVELLAGTPFLVHDLADLQVGSQNQSMRLALTPIARSVDTAAPDVNYWAFGDSVGGWLNTAVNSASFLTFALPVMAGDVINSITATVKGGAGVGHGGVDPTFKMSMQLYRGPTSGSGGAYTLITTGSDPATGAAYDGDHFFTISPAHTAADRYYIVKLASEFGGSATGGENLLYTIQALITRNRVVSGNNFGS